MICDGSSGESVNVEAPVVGGGSVPESPPAAVNPPPPPPPPQPMPTQPPQVVVHPHPGGKQCSDNFQPQGNDMKVICYFTNWAIYRLVQ